MKERELRLVCERDRYKINRGSIGCLIGADLSPLTGGTIFIDRIQVEFVVMQKNRKRSHNAEADHNETGKPSVALFVFE